MIRKTTVMLPKIFLAILAIIPAVGIADTGKDLATYAGENNLVTVKNFCIDYWTTDKDRLTIMSKFSSVSEICGCIQDDMKFTVSDELAIRVLRMQMDHEAGTTSKYLSDEDMLRTTKEWHDRYTAASISCGERFMRRRSQR